MEVALALAAAIDNFLDQIRAWTRNSDLPSEAQNEQVLLSELTDRLHKADKSLFNTLYQLSGRAAQRAFIRNSSILSPTARLLILRLPAGLRCSMPSPAPTHWKTDGPG